MKKRILLSASLFHGLNDAATVTVPMIFPILFSQKLLISRYSHIGILSNLGLLITLLFQILIAGAAHKHEYKLMLLVSIGGLSLTLALLPFSGSFGILVFFYLFLRLFASFYHSVGVATVSRAYTGHDLDSAMGIQNGSGNLGVFLAFISSGWLAQRFGWRVPLFAWSGGILILGAASYLAAAKTTTLIPDAPAPDHHSWKESILSIRRYIPGFIFGGACWGTTVYFAPSLLHHKFEVSMGMTGVFLAIWIGIGIITNYGFGFLCRKLGRNTLTLAGISGAALFLLLLGISPSRSLAVVSLFFFGGSLFFTYPAFQTMVSASVSGRHQTHAFSLVANIQMLTGATVNLIAGFLSDSLGIHTPFIFLSVLGLAVMVYFVTRGFEPRIRAFPRKS